MIADAKQLSIVKMVQATHIVHDIRLGLHECLRVNIAKPTCRIEAATQPGDQGRSLQGVPLLQKGEQTGGDIKMRGDGLETSGSI